jgi:hypothetical protein
LRRDEQGLRRDEHGSSKSKAQAWLAHSKAFGAHFKVLATCLALVFLMILCSEALASGVEFGPEERVTSDSRAYEMTRNSNHALAVDALGRVHLAYWEGTSLESVDTSHPSAVWYSRRGANGRWAAPELVDNSVTSAGIRVGARHPSLLLGSGGTVHVFWHDYRHCSASRKWIDNVELYRNTRPPGGPFGADVRITRTAADHDGDNSYSPQAVLAPDGRIVLAWYDYHFDGEIADIFVMRFDERATSFGESLAPYRVTDAAQRGDTPSFGQPDVAVDPSGRIHVVWTVGNSPGAGVYYARYEDHTTSPAFTRSEFTLQRAASRSTLKRELQTSAVLSATGAGYYDPPHIAVAPGGAVYALWTEPGNDGKDLVLARLDTAAPGHDPPLRVTSLPADQSHGDFKVGRDGVVHLVWEDTREGPAEIFYGRFDPAQGTLAEETRVSHSSNSGCQYPAVALDATGAVHIAWTDYRHGVGQIYYRTTAPRSSARPTWVRYH